MSARLLSGEKHNASAYTFSNIGGDFRIEYPTDWSYTEEFDGTCLAKN